MSCVVLQKHLNLSVYQVKSEVREGHLNPSSTESARVTISWKTAEKMSSYQTQ